jgi:hypothetical protein
MFKQLFTAMMKEEWRLHTALFSNNLFAFFPLVIGLITGIACLFLPFLQTIVTLPQLFQYTHYLFLFFGVSIGAFGLFGKEIMNRRFGQASLIAYSSRSLPVSEQVIFLSFFLKDIIYYLLLWIVPMYAGFIIVSPLIGLSMLSSLYACGSLTLSFLLGLSLVFLLSTIYAHSSKLLIIVLTVLLVLYGLLRFATPLNLNIALMPYTLYYHFTLEFFSILLILIIVPSLLSVYFVKIDYPEKKRYHANQLPRLTKRFAFSTYSFYIAKDFIDLQRSEGGLGKIIFSFLLPVGLTYLFLQLFVELIPTIKILMIFSVFLGIVSTSIYNMLTAFDAFTPYLFLPVRVSTIIKSKITSYHIINLCSVVILVIAAITMNQLLYFLPAVLMFFSITLFTLAITIYFTGLNPNVLIYNSKIFLPYMASVAPLLFVFTFLSILNPWYMLASPLVLPLAFLLLKKSYTKWDRWVPQGI